MADGFWCQLKPIDENEKVRRSAPVITFSALKTGRFFISGDEATGYVLIENSAANQCNVFLVVSENSQVVLEVSDDAKIEVQTNEEKIEKGSKSNPLMHNDRVRIGSRLFVFIQENSELRSLLSKMRQMVKCPGCPRSNDTPVMLPCGHSICSKCIQTKIQIAMTTPVVDEHRAPMDLELIRLFGAQDIAAQTRQISCGVCSQMIPVWRAQGAIQQKQIGLTMKTMREWCDFDEEKPRCSKCKNQRCVIGSNDFVYRESSKEVLCPACAVESDGLQEMRSRQMDTQKLREMEKRLQLMALNAAQCEKRNKAIRSKMAAMVNEAKAEVNDMKNALGNSNDACSSSIRQIQKGSVEMGISASESLDKMEADFKKQLAEAEKVAGKAEKVAEMYKEKIAEAEAEIKEKSEPPVEPKM